jgi:hypothetical protein
MSIDASRWNTRIKDRTRLSESIRIRIYKKISTGNSNNKRGWCFALGHKVMYSGLGSFQEAINKVKW